MKQSPALPKKWYPEERSWEGYSSDGSVSCFTPEMSNRFQLPHHSYKAEEGWGESMICQMFISDKAEMHKDHDLSGPYQTKSGGRSRAKLSPAHKKANKRQNDYIHTQKLKRTIAELTAENRRLEMEMEIQHLKLENKKLKRLVDENMNLKRRVCKLHCQKIPISSVATDEKHYATQDQQNSEVATSNGNKLPIKYLLEKFDEDDESNVWFSDFTGLDADRVKVGRYSFPLSLRPVVDKITAAHGDVSATSKMNFKCVEHTYILFCASIKEMEGLHLDQVTEERILKWRDAIKDALRIDFKVEFAMEHLKKIARAYVGLMERKKAETVATRIAKLEADLSAGKEEHAKILEQCKEYMDSADKSYGKPAS